MKKLALGIGLLLCLCGCKQAEIPAGTPDPFKEILNMTADLNGDGKQDQVTFFFQKVTYISESVPDPIDYQLRSYLSAIIDGRSYDLDISESIYAQENVQTLRLQDGRDALIAALDVGGSGGLKEVYAIEFNGSLSLLPFPEIEDDYALCGYSANVRLLDQYKMEFYCNETAYQSEYSVKEWISWLEKPVYDDSGNLLYDISGFLEPISEIEVISYNDSDCVLFRQKIYTDPYRKPAIAVFESIVAWNEDAELIVLKQSLCVN